MKKRQNQKTPRTFAEPVVAESRRKVTLQEYGDFKVGDTVFFNTSLTNFRYNRGTLREIVVQSEDVVIFSIWDDEKGMWRSFHPQSVYSQRPKNARGKG